MILVEAGTRDDRSFDARLIFAVLLAERGHPVVLDEEAIPDTFDRSQKYDAAPFLAKLDDVELSDIVVLSAEDLSEDTLIRLRTIARNGSVRVVGIGRFSDNQSRVAARSRLAYAVGREPDMVDLTDLFPSPLPVSAVSPLAAPVRPPRARVPEVPEVYVYAPPEWLEEPLTLPVLAALDAAGSLRLTIVSSGKGKDIVRRSRHAALSILGLSEIGPALMAREADVAVFFGEAIPGERMAAFALDMMAGGKAVIDSTSGAALQSSGAPVLRGPEDILALQNYLERSVIVNLTQIGRAGRDSPWLSSRSIARLEAAAGLAPPDEVPGPTPASPRAVFVPTNGVGLGHARRCTLVAAALSDPGTAVFAAFPSCVPMIRGEGFSCLPLVQKSEDHPEDFANDIVNNARLRRLVGPDDHLVFDGGYVFDSLYRTIRESGCSATWIRRGLWQPAHLFSVQTEREAVFSRIVVPEEAFEELNDSAPRSTKARRVGPIVLPAPEVSAGEVRARLEGALGLAFDTLVVSMLGGGVAADRSAQLQALAGQLARRPRTLHLIVVWPNATVAPGLFGWPNTRVVRTEAPLALCTAADLVVSAVGYNSFHEMMYHRVPAIFVPQVAPSTDDQERRARAASERGLAATVLAHEVLGLERAVVDVLDNGLGADFRSRLAAVDLPAAGNAPAARIIEEAMQR